MAGGAQRRRTRRALLDAARGLLAAGETPTLDDVATAAEVSRATAYRVFGGLDGLLAAAAQDLTLPNSAQLFRGLTDASVEQRLERLESAVARGVEDGRIVLRLGLSRALARGTMLPGGQHEIEARIDEALSSEAFEQDVRLRLRAALRLMLGPETIVIAEQLSPQSAREARRLRRWIIAALVAAARRG